MQDAELALLIDRFMRRIHFGLQSKGPSFDTEKVGPGGGIVLLTLSDMGCPSLHELTFYSDLLGLKVIESEATFAMAPLNERVLLGWW